MSSRKFLPIGIVVVLIMIFAVNHAQASTSAALHEIARDNPAYSDTDASRQFVTKPATLGGRPRRPRWKSH